MNFFANMWRFEGQANLSLKPSNSLRFPAVDFTHPEPACFLMNFFNLTGVDSPLPHYLLELALQNKAFSDFLAIFNEQFYHLLYAIWKKSHPLANQTSYQRWLSFFLGFQGHSSLLPYADCWVLKPGMLGLKKALQRCLGSIPFSVTECVGHWFDLDKAQALPVNLGNAMLGDQFFSHRYCVECRVGPVLPQQAVDVNFLKDLLACFAEGVTLKLIIGFEDSLLRLGNNTLGGFRLFPVRQAHVFFC